MEQAIIQGGVVRRLWPADLPAFRDHLLRLDAQSRYDRYAMAVNPYSLRRALLRHGWRGLRLLRGWGLAWRG